MTAMNVAPRVPEDARAYIDESGAKGFADNPKPGEFGLLLAVVIPTAEEATLRAKLDPSFRTFKGTLPAGMKVHITDAITSCDASVKATAEATRDAFVQVAGAANLSVMYEALSARRFAPARDNLSALASSAKAVRRSDVRITAHAHRDRLDEELFVGLCVKIDCNAQEREFAHVGLVSDTLDPAIKDAYQRTLDSARGAGDRVDTVKGFELSSKTKVSGTIRVKTEVPTRSGFEPAVTRLGDVAVQVAPDPLLLLADILANSLRYHLAQLDIDVDPLNAPASTVGWSLASKLWGQMDDYFMDAL